MVINPFSIDIKIDEDVNLRLVCDRFVRERQNIINRYSQGLVDNETLEREIRVFLTNNKIDASKVKKVKDILFGYDILQTYIDDPDITDILVNNPRTIFVKKFGKKYKVPEEFDSVGALEKYCYKIVAMNGGTINKNQAQVVVTDRTRNLRIVVTLPPIAVGSPTISIRKPAASQTLDDLMRAGMFDYNIRNLLKQYVRDYKTIIIAGKGGSGKTTLLGALINEVPLNDRGLLIQETMEILPKHPDIQVHLIRVSDNEEIKDYTLFDLTRTALLESLDRIFIGEMKDREAYDFFNAVYTGHNGSMATVHANSADEVIDRLLYLMSRAETNMSESKLEEMLRSSLDVVIFLRKFKIASIKELRK